MSPTCGHIFVLFKAGKRDVGSAHVPNVDVVVQQERAVGDVIATLRPPLDAAHRGNGLHHVQQLCGLLVDIPHLCTTKYTIFYCLQYQEFVLNVTVKMKRLTLIHTESQISFKERDI